MSVVANDQHASLKLAEKKFIRHFGAKGTLRF